MTAVAEHLRPLLEWEDPRLRQLWATLGTEPAPPETITDAAIKIGAKANQIVTGNPHFRAWFNAADEGLFQPLVANGEQLRELLDEQNQGDPFYRLIETLDIEEGFVTSTGRFVDREEAYRLAYPKFGDEGILDSAQIPRRAAGRNPVAERPAFKQWFTGSVVTDSGSPGGNPIIVYHGTPFGGFSKFKPSSGGIYFTTSGAEASDYAMGGFEWKAADAKSAAVYPAYLRITNPFIVWEETADLIDVDVNWCKQNGYDGVIGRYPSAHGETTYYAVFSNSQIWPAFVPRTKRKAAKVTLPKLRRLFDDAAQGMIDEALLDEVYSEWHAFLGERLSFYQRVIKTDEATGDVTRQKGHYEVIEQIRAAVAELEHRYTAPAKDKLLALNKAIQIYHRHGPLLYYHGGIQSREERQVTDFLDWLSERRSFDEKQPPKRKGAERDYPLATKEQMQTYEDFIDWKGKVKWMSPAEFLRLTPVSAKEPELGIPDWYWSHSGLEDLRHKMETGRPLDPLVLELNANGETIGHEGRHRAKTALELGIGSVPVLVIGPWPRVPDWTAADQARFDRLELLPQGQKRQAAWQPTHQSILSLIGAVRKEFGHDFTGGDCGQFAIALVRVLRENGISADYVVESGSHWEHYDHVAVAALGHLYDGTGEYHKPTGKGYDDWRKEEYDIQYDAFPHGEDSEQAIQRHTDPAGVFGHDTDWESILESLRRHASGQIRRKARLSNGSDAAGENGQLEGLLGGGGDERLVSGGQETAALCGRAGGEVVVGERRGALDLGATGGGDATGVLASGGVIHYATSIMVSAPESSPNEKKIPIIFAVRYGADLHRNVFAHMLNRLEEVNPATKRQRFPLEDRMSLLRDLQTWLFSRPLAPGEEWYKPLGLGYVTGTHDWPTTLLGRDMQPYGVNLDEWRPPRPPYYLARTTYRQPDQITIVRAVRAARLANRREASGLSLEGFFDQIERERRADTWVFTDLDTGEVIRFPKTPGDDSKHMELARKHLTEGQRYTCRSEISGDRRGVRLSNCNDLLARFPFLDCPALQRVANALHPERTLVAAISDGVPVVEDETLAGIARYDGKSLRLNPAQIKDAPEQAVAAVIVHETVHFLRHRLGGHAPGAEDAVPYLERAGERMALTAETQYLRDSGMERTEAAQIVVASLPATLRETAAVLFADAWAAAPYQPVHHSV